MTGGVALARINTSEKEASNTEAASGGLPWQVERDCKWLEQTVQRVGSLLSESLPLVRFVRESFGMLISKYTSDSFIYSVSPASFRSLN